MDNLTSHYNENQSRTADGGLPSCSKDVSTSVKHSPTQYSGDFGRYFSEQYSVLKLVLCHLDYYDLCTMRRVNSKFKSAVDIILLRDRMYIQYATLEYKQGTTENSSMENLHMDRPPNNALNNNNHCIDLRIEPRTLFTFECMPGSGGPSRCRPKICTRLRESTSRSNGDDRCRDTGSFFPRGDIVPNSVTTFVPIGAKGIIYTENKKPNERTKVKNSKQLLFSYSSHDKKLVLLYLPTSNNYEVSVITRVITSSSSSSPSVLSQEDHTFFAHQGPPIRGLLFLKVGSSFAVSGGHVTSLDYNSPPKKKNSLIPGVLQVIIFRGEGICCVSDVISSTTEHGILLGLKETEKHVNQTWIEEDGVTLDSRRSFIMSFQCIDRQQLEDHKYLSMVWPSIPLFGVQTWGEIGLRSFEVNNLEFPPIKKKRYSIMHSVKTTFMIITLK